MRGVRNQRGMTLVETLAAVAIGCMCVVIAGTMLRAIYLGHDRAVQHTELMDQLNLASFQVADLLQEATQVELVSTCPNVSDANTGSTYICVQSGVLKTLVPNANGTYTMQALANQHPITYSLQATGTTDQSISIVVTARNARGEQQTMSTVVHPINLQTAFAVTSSKGIRLIQN
jgi:prepilin-type N-terminal cleavage/methylation domain-containing protein